MSLGLLVAIAVIAVVAVKLFGGGRLLGRRSAGGLLEVIARQPLEPRRSLYVVRVGERRLLVGTSELGVTMLTELAGEEAGAREASEARAAERPASFAELVREATSKWTAGRRAAVVAADGAGAAQKSEAAAVEASGEERLPS